MICRRTTSPLSRKRCLTLEMIRNLDREFDLQKIGTINRDASIAQWRRTIA
ncbi:MAG: hypothetical protein QQW96_14180 [Tychonema bourrellyi B0820]|uniref:hypothetical protein n=1 Tax=Tychonema bourrellyi TaxID=54313 RepID=UPI0015D4FAFE|nr:hypothetical protein [Tychonema bourrellyi]MDQ2098785.1 hypothetical protein [Tychonema bourrellyi B0820]